MADTAPTEATPEPTVADVLRDAANVLRRDGWCRGTMHQPTGEHCAIGAITTALGPPSTDRTRLYASTADAFRTFINTGSIPIWNDYTALDGEDVAARMEKAAAAWEEVQGL